MDRAELASRIIPEMTLSTGDAPLTAPLPVPSALSPAERAIARFSLSGNAVVTGGTGDLGFVVSRALLEHGVAYLLIWDQQNPLSDARVQALRAEFPAAKVVFSAVDVTSEEEVDAAAHQAKETYGGIDILLTFAGVVGVGHAAELAAHEWRRVFDVNAAGSFICAKAVANVMAQAGKGGSIVHVASISAHRVNFPQPQVAYNASKAAVLAMTKSLAAEWAVHGIRVNSISPGYMDTILNEGDGLEAARSVWNQRNPAGRMGSPEELCGAIILLTSPAGRYITGADILIDGGQILF